MVEYGIGNKTEMLFEQFMVGLIVYNNEGDITSNCLEERCRSLGINKYNPLTLIPDLIACGIIYASIDWSGNLCYQITEFGKYFFDMIREQKSHTLTFIEEIRSEM